MQRFCVKTERQSGIGASQGRTEVPKHAQPLRRSGLWGSFARRVQL